MTSTASLTIRHAIAADEADLTRLAALDSSRVPSGELLVAEVDGSLVAALSIDTGAAIADPFEHTAAIVDSLRAQARESRAPRPAILPGHLGRALFGRACRPRALAALAASQHHRGKCRVRTATARPGGVRRQRPGSRIRGDCQRRVRRRQSRGRRPVVRIRRARPRTHRP